VVARAIQDQMLGRDESHVLLDISHKPAGKVQTAFPCMSPAHAMQALYPVACSWYVTGILCLEPQQQMV
jgi:aspartate oxidase